MSDVKLRPCPGCGIGDEIQAEMVRAGRKERVRCDCGWLGPARDSQLEAAAAWNTRSESPVEKAAGEMREVLQRYREKHKTHASFLCHDYRDMPQVPSHLRDDTRCEICKQVDVILASYDAVTKGENCV